MNMRAQCWTLRDIIWLRPQQVLSSAFFFFLQKALLCSDLHSRRTPYALVSVRRSRTVGHYSRTIRQLLVGKCSGGDFSTTRGCPSLISFELSHFLRFSSTLSSQNVSANMAFTCFACVLTAPGVLLSSTIISHVCAPIMVYWAVRVARINCGYRLSRRQWQRLSVAMRTWTEGIRLVLHHLIIPFHSFSDRSIGASHRRILLHEVPKVQTILRATRVIGK